MGIVTSILAAALIGAAAVSPQTVATAQSAAPSSAGSTQAAAPAAISPAAASAQAASAAATANSATLGSQAKQAGDAGTRSPAAGITGVPRYRAGFRGPKGTSAPNATASVGVTGDADGNGLPDGTALLPGIATFRNGVKAGTPIQVRLQSPVDSGHARNGDIVRGILVAPVGDAPAGAPVELTVVAAAAAGQMTSAGELSLQVVKVNGTTVLSEVITATGEEGKKIIPDAAPERGTEAIFTPEKPLTLPAA
ncbi:hypothetical protein [Terriglobus roseus]|uniref:Uncharacterized protein n=1 Tax=Terriglobus roseus TaxID=392734 RepID=A0A1H4LRI8_9BACT|nr:hypothetical protein [Terriglobus roseus]SEB73214.1 hypothetical protein SAMN05443244_1688 [Terriglobus roseus]